MLVYMTQVAADETAQTNGSLVMSLGIIFAVLVYFIVLVVYLDKKKHKNAQDVINANIFKEKKAAGSTRLYDFYRALDRIPIIRPWLRNLEAKLLPLYPSDEIASARSFTKPLVKIVGLSAGGMGLSLFLIWGLKPSLYTLLAAILVGYGISVMMTVIVVSDEKLKFYEGYDRLLDSISHFYGAEPNVVRSIDKASSTLDERIVKRHAEELMGILKEQQFSKQINIYMGKNRDEFLKTFLLVASKAAENGNIMDENGSVFLQSINTIREDLHEKREASKSKMFAFATFGWIAILPCIAQPYIQNWGIGVMASMTKFYIGRIGMIMKLAILLLSFISFTIVITFQAEQDFIRENKMMSRICGSSFVKRFVDTFHDPDDKKTFRVKEIMRRSGDRNVYRSYYVKRVIYAVIMAAVVFFVMLAGHKENREYLKFDTLSLEEASQNADSKQSDAIVLLVPQYVQNYIATGERYNADELAEKLIVEPGIRTHEVAIDAGKLIVDRLERYDKEIFDFLDILVMAVFALVGFFYPTLILKMRETVVRDKTADEVDRFAKITNMLRNAPGINTLAIIEALETFAVVYKVPLRKCINYFHINGERALRELYLSEKNEDFRKIVRNLMRVDEVGVRIAFESTAIDIKNNGEARRNDRIRRDKKQENTAMAIALVPGGFILFGYLMLPFLGASLEAFNEFSELMNTVG